MFLTLDQKLEMIKLSEEGMSKSWDRLEARHLVPGSQVVNIEKHFWKKIKIDTSVNTQMTKKKKWNSLIVDMETVVV